MLSKTLKTGADIIYQSLIRNSVKDVFLYSGGSIMPTIDKFYNGQINYYVNTHEQNSGHSATIFRARYFVVNKTKIGIIFNPLTTG